MREEVGGRERTRVTGRTSVSPGETSRYEQKGKLFNIIPSSGDP